MTTANKVLNIAASQLGYVEGRNNYSKFGKWYGIPGYANAAWCAMFVSWCFEKAGIPLPAIQHPKGFAYCPYGVSYFRQIGRLYKIPKVGDIVFFDWQRDGTSDHVGLVLTVNGNRRVTTIEGNTSPKDNSNGGQVMKRSRSLYHCLGFARPHYQDAGNDFSGRYMKLQSPMLQGFDVRQMQEQLFKHGYNIDIDGVFGKETRSSILLFQAAKGLEVDGIVGPQTWNALFGDV